MNRLWRGLLALTMVFALTFVVAACGDDEEKPAAQEETTDGGSAAAKTKQDMKVVGMYIEQEANILGTKGFESPEELKGSNAKIAVSRRGTRSYVKMVQMLEEAGVDP